MRIFAEFLIVIQLMLSFLGFRGGIRCQTSEVKALSLSYELPYEISRDHFSSVVPRY